MVACMCVRGRGGATNLDFQRQGIERDDMNGFRMTSVVVCSNQVGMNTWLCYLRSQTQLYTDVLVDNVSHAASTKHAHSRWRHLHRCHGC